MSEPMDSGQQASPRASHARRGQSSSQRGHHQPRRRGGNPSGTTAESAGSSSGAFPSAEPGQENAARRGRRGGGGQRARQGRGGTTSHIAPRRMFGGRLTSSDTSASPLSGAAAVFVPGQPVAPASAAPPAAGKPSAATAQKSSATDLPTRIHEDIDNGQYECVICTSEVVRSSQIWSCHICWTVTHLHCVKKWHKNQTQKSDQQPQAQPDQPGSWRCPGCNSSMSEDPGPNTCWCGKEVNPRHIPGLPSHSCGQTCSRTRARCPHPCSLSCHAGPCPPCSFMATQSCFCGKQTTTKRCTETDYNGWSCQTICDDLLPCGEHTCSRLCHQGLCGSCDVPVISYCYCGKTRKQIPCEERDEVLESFNYGQQTTEQAGPKEEEEAEEAEVAVADAGSWFDGCFHCQTPCGRPFDCSHHHCEKPCHPQDEEQAHCPFSPDKVTHCPCGKTALTELLSTPRTSCQDEVPHCELGCGKELPCGHPCTRTCHTGPCDSEPCREPVSVPCRCGRTSTETTCFLGGDLRPECSRVCRAVLSCGKHVCGNTCCADERKAIERQAAKRKKNVRPVPAEVFEAEHICLKTCGKPLSCQKHTCQNICHRGPCLSCPEAIFEEISCACGRTVLQPPQPCGTVPPQCRYDCTRPRPCGHPEVKHNCHPADTPCPICPFLVDKTCVCGKQIIKNKPCGLDEAHCGLACNKVLKCGFHHCSLTCHRPGQCEDKGILGSHCSQRCGRTRQSCEHQCMDTCHSPYPCKEDKPCQAKTFITCECQHRKQEVKCLATKTNPSPTHEALKCDDECKRLQRNAKLAQALNIDPTTHTDTHIPYSQDTLSFAKENVAWTQTQEREFRVFADDPSAKRLNFKPMTAPQRAFIHSLAEDFGLDSLSQDPEPLRHVSIFKTPRFVSAPRKTLAQCLRIAQTTQVLHAAELASAPTRATGTLAFNAIILSSPRFGLTIDEVDEALASDLAAKGTTGPPLSFTTVFLPSDEIIIKAGVVKTAASIIRAGAATTPEAIEKALVALKPGVARTVKETKLAEGVGLGYIDDEQKIIRREGDAASGSGGWNAVVSRAAKRPARPVVSADSRKAPSSFVAFKRPEARKMAESKPAEVPDDWAATAEEDETTTATTVTE